MKCISCSEDVSSKFKFALDQNSCPFCGQVIIVEELHKIFQGLKTVMEEAKPFMEEVEEWLFTNYSIGKAKKQAKVQNTNGSETDNSGNIFDTDMDEETIRRQTELAQQRMTSEFQQRAGVKSNAGLKSVVNQIKAASGAAGMEEFIGIDPDYGPIDMSKEATSPLSNEEKDQMKSIINAQYQVKENDKENAVKEYYELQKVKKLQQQQKSGPKFSRTE